MHGNAGVKGGYSTRSRVNFGAAFPTQPLPGELFFRTDLKAMFIQLGIGETGCDAAGWFNMKQAVYAP